MGNILNKTIFGCVWNATETVNKCLGIVDHPKKKDTNDLSTPKPINSMNKEYSDYDIIDRAEIYP